MDLEGDELGGEELGDEELGDEELGDEEMPDEEETLLATPGKRDPKGRPYNSPTPGDKGKKYVSAKHTGGDRRPHGAYVRHLSSLSAGETAKSTPRSYLKGYVDGIRKPFDSLKVGISEDLDSTYKEEEESIFEVNNQIKGLITLLESKDNNETQA
jgi:hypothetical protein